MVHDGFGGGVELECMQDTEAKENGIHVKGDSECCYMCLELDRKWKKAEEICSVLQVETDKKRSGIELLGSELILSLVQNYVLESLVESSKDLDGRITHAVAEDGKGEKDIIDLSEDVEEDKVLELMIENKVLDCEKKKAETESEFWKAKCRELEVQVASLELKLSSTFKEGVLPGTNNAGLVSPRRVKKDMILTDVLQDDCCGVGTPMLDTFCGNVSHVNGAGGEIINDKGQGCISQAKRHLNFVEGNPDKMAPLTPAAGQPAAAGVIDISDTDEEASDLNRHVLHESRNKTHAPDDSGGGSASYKNVVSSCGNMVGVIDQSEIEDDMTHCCRRTPSLRASKRKRASHVVCSDSGSDTDDNVPLSKLRKSYSNEANVLPRQENYSEADGGCVNREVDSVTNEPFEVSRKSRRGGLRKQYSRSNLKKSEGETNRSIPTSGSFTDDETEDNESESEGESLRDFIVSGSGSDFSEVDESSEGDEISKSSGKSDSESKEEAEPNMDYNEIMDKIGRRKDHLTKWGFEADMLAALGKDPELCMKAVCALYRKQTADEKMYKATIHQNQRGFSQCDATRGSILGEFLTEGDPEGGLKKTVEELREFNPKGVELCTTLATHYSKQLFAMYENNEDPLWPDLGTKC